MKEIAVVKLTKSLFGKMGEKIVAKKKKWAEEAAISVEENKRREAEFKEDFKKLKEKLKPDVIKEEIQKSVEVAKELKTKVEEGVRSDAANEVMKASVKKVEKNSVAKLEESSEKKTVAKVVEEPVKPVAVEKPASKKTDEKAVIKEKSEKPVVKETEKKVTETKKPVAKKVEKSVSKSTQTSKKSAAKKTPANKKETNKLTTAKKKETSTKKPASKREAKIALYSADITKHYGKVDEAFLTIIVKNLGPSIYRKDAELVSCSDSKELDTVKNNFLVKKLQMKESDDVLNAAIKEVCEELKASRNKYRATFYYALAKKFKQESKLS